MNTERHAWALWAKSGDAGTYLPLPQHLSDTLGVARILWDSAVSTNHVDLLRAHTGLSDDALRSSLAFLAGTHDVGKAILTFQSQLDRAPDGAVYLERIRSSGLDVSMLAGESTLPRFRHETASGILLSGWLTAHGVSPKAAQSWSSVVDAHHGKPTPPHLVEGARMVLDEYPEPWKNVHAWLIDRAADESGIRNHLDSLPTLSVQSQHVFAALVIMADWIASNVEAFPLDFDGPQEQRVQDGCSAIDLTLPWLPPEAPESLEALFRERFMWGPERRVRPAQLAAAEAARSSQGPALLILEAPTGNGKTEAALVAAEILAERSGAGGLMLAAPTMSTANGLFARALAWARAATGAGELTSMYLAHSRTRLVDEYNQLRLRGIDPSSGGEGVVVASQWMSGRKKGILSTFVVGTVDQVLLGALQAKHWMLRHLGLSSKVVVIDEVHSYDVYMSSYLSTVLAWLGSYGTPVILLSATLPVAQKQQLAHAYRDGLRKFARERGRAQPIELSTAYPLVTLVSAGAVEEIPVEMGPVDIAATVTMMEDSETELLATVADLTAEGGCVLILCNTVRRAQQAYQALAHHYATEVELHHAAFTANDRATREDALRAKLGPNASRGSGRPHRLIVVATQVAEQSLDIDVDALITDIAPMDLLIQRMGRVHRHERALGERPRRLAEPRVFIRGVTEPLSETQAPEFDAGAVAVYGRRMLMSTAALVLRRVTVEGFTRPHDVASLVQAAYAHDPAIPEGWARAWHEAITDDERRQQSQQSRARTYRIAEPREATLLGDMVKQLHDAPRRNAEESEQFGLAQVRDSSPSLEVIPIVVSDTGYMPLSAPPGWGAQRLVLEHAPERAQAFELAARVLRLPSSVGRDPRRLDVIIDALERATPSGWRKDPLLKGMIALPFDENGFASIPGFNFSYHRDLGLVTEPAKS